MQPSQKWLALEALNGSSVNFQINMTCRKHNIQEFSETDLMGIASSFNDTSLRAMSMCPRNINIVQFHTKNAL